MKNALKEGDVRHCRSHFNINLLVIVPKKKRGC